VTIWKVCFMGSRAIAFQAGVGAPSSPPQNRLERGACGQQRRSDLNDVDNGSP